MIDFEIEQLFTKNPDISLKEFITQVAYYFYKDDDFITNKEDIFSSDLKINENLYAKNKLKKSLDDFIMYKNISNHFLMSEIDSDYEENLNFAKNYLENNSKVYKSISLMKEKVEKWDVIQEISSFKQRILNILHSIESYDQSAYYLDYLKKLEKPDSKVFISQKLDNINYDINSYLKSLINNYRKRADILVFLSKLKEHVPEE